MSSTSPAEENASSFASDATHTSGADQPKPPSTVPRRRSVRQHQQSVLYTSPLWGPWKGNKYPQPQGMRSCALTSNHISRIALRSPHSKQGSHTSGGHSCSSACAARDGANCTRAWGSLGGHAGAVWLPPHGTCNAHSCIATAQGTFCIRACCGLASSAHNDTQAAHPRHVSSLSGQRQSAVLLQRAAAAAAVDLLGEGREAHELAAATTSVVLKCLAHLPH